MNKRNTIGRYWAHGYPIVETYAEASAHARAINHAVGRQYVTPEDVIGFAREMTQYRSAEAVKKRTMANRQAILTRKLVNQPLEVELRGKAGK